MDPIREGRKQKSGRQLGDPRLAGEAILKLIASPHPPTHLPLGADAITFVRKAQAERAAEIAAWEPVARSTDFI